MREVVAWIACIAIIASATVACVFIAYNPKVCPVLPAAPTTYEVQQ